MMPLLVAAMSATLTGQAATATVHGSLTDQSGGILTATTVTLSNVAAPQVTVTLQTDQSGLYEFEDVPPGAYVLEVRRSGFETLQSELTLEAGESVQRNVTLQIGTIHETLTITDAESAAPPADAPPAQPAVQEMLERLRARPVDDSCRGQAIGGCVKPPVKLTQVRPVYPVSLQGTGMAGLVLVRGRIALDGSVAGLDVLESAHPDFAQAALDAISEWRYEPTTLNGEIVETDVEVSVYFSPRP